MGRYSAESLVLREGGVLDGLFDLVLGERISMFFQHLQLESRMICQSDLHSYPSFSSPHRA